MDRSRLVPLLFAFLILPVGCSEQPEPTLGESEGRVTGKGEAVVEEVKAFFAELKAALDEQNDGEIRDLFAPEVTVALLDRQDLLPDALDDTDQVIRLLGQAVPPRLYDPVAGVAWSRMELGRVRVLQEGREVLVYARHWDANDITTRMRWWLYRVDEAWRLYDYEVLEAAIRFSTGLAMGFKMADENDPATREIPRLLEAAGLTSQGEAEEALAIIEELESTRFPPVLEALLLSNAAAALAHLERFEEALGYADRCAALETDLPILDYLYAIIYNGLGRHDEAMKSAESYAEELGPDADYFIEMGDAWAGKGEKEKARESYRAGLRDDPQSGLSFLGLLRVLEPGEKRSLTSDYETLNDPEGWFEAFAEHLVKKEDVDSLTALLELHESRCPDDGNLEVYREKLAELERGN
jgi:tetratricopeptide (TPR) repeat protein